MREIGFSTGAIALADYKQALRYLALLPTHAVELSALRFKELQPLISELAELDLKKYTYISMHVPSVFSAQEEVELVSLLDKVPSNWALILHPDAIHDCQLWRSLTSRVAIENMDRRKHCGRTANELAKYFEMLPNARFCFDIGHARQFDPSMAEAYTILTAFPEKLVQVHVSEVDTQSRHATITYAAELAFREVAHLIPEHVPLILESRVSAEEIESEMLKVASIFAYQSLEAVAC